MSVSMFDGPSAFGTTAFVLALSTVTSALAEPATGPSAADPRAGAKIPEPSLASLSLDEAIAYASAHQPSMRLARARIAEARARAEVPQGQWRPRVGAVAELFAATANNSTATYLTNSMVDIPRIGGTSAITSDKVDAASLKPYASSFVGIGLDQELFDFGRIAAQTAAFDAEARAEGYRAEGDRLDLELSVREAYFAVTSAKAVVQAADAAFDRAKSQRDATQAGLDNGLRTPVDVARADADLARWDVGRVRARGSLDLARSLLAAVIAYEAPEVDTKDAASSTSSVPTLERALADAAKRDPVVAAAEERLKAQAAATRAIDAERRPNLFLSSTLSARAGGAPLANGSDSVGRGFLPVIPNWDVGVVLSVPIYDGVTQARRHASEARETVLREEVSLVRQREDEAVERAYFALKTADAAIPALERALVAAKTSYAQTKARFDQGLGTSVDLMDAQAVLTSAEIELALGQFDRARAVARLARATAEP
jgi:outer membrane protein TolC